METHQIVGGALILMAIADLGAGAFVTSRVEDRQKKLILSLGLVSGAVFMFGLGVAFLLGVIPLGGSGS
jgi:hypothetical protein